MCIRFAMLKWVVIFLENYLENESVVLESFLSPDPEEIYIPWTPSLSVLFVWLDYLINQGML